jgi:hypothetical protein
METKSQLYNTLKNLTNELNQATLKVIEESENSGVLLDFKGVKSLATQVLETSTILEYLQKNEDIVDEEILEKNEIIVDNNNLTVESSQEEEEEEEEEEEVIVNVSFDKTISQETTSGNSGNGNEALADKFMNKGITDLNSAIGISEKFMFIHELFKGNTEEYIAALNKLNNCSDLSDATQTVESLETKFSWDQETPAYQELNNIITRKYPA